MYGIGAVKYKDFVVGYIEKGSFDLGGQKPEAAKIEAEQVPGAPVLVIAQSNGSIAPTFNVIQMDFDNLHKLLGGRFGKENSDRLDGPLDRDGDAGPLGTCPCVREEHPDAQCDTALQFGRQADPDRNGEDRVYVGGGNAGGRFTALRCVRYGIHSQ